MVFKVVPESVWVFALPGIKPGPSAAIDYAQPIGPSLSSLQS